MYLHHKLFCQLLYYCERVVLLFLGGEGAGRGVKGNNDNASMRSGQTYFMILCEFTEKFTFSLKKCDSQNKMKQMGH